MIVKNLAVQRGQLLSDLCCYVYKFTNTSHSYVTKVIRALPNATVFCTVVVIITLKTILNEKVGYHFCLVILLFWLRQMQFHKKYKIEK